MPPRRTEGAQAQLRADLGNLPPKAKLADGSLLAAVKLSVKEAAARIGVGATTLRRMINDGQIPVLKINEKLMLLESDLEEYLRGHYGPVSVPPSPRANSRIPMEITDSDVLSLE